MISFKNFLMEGFDPNMKIEFGVNHPEFTDEKFSLIQMNTGHNEIVSYFHYRDYSFCVQLYPLNNFRYMLSYSINDKDYIESLDKISSSDFHITFVVDNTGIQNELLIILNIVLIIVLKAIKQYDFIDTLEFTGTKKELDVLYSKLAKNKSFIKIVEQAGYAIKDIDGKVVLTKTQ